MATTECWIDKSTWGEGPWQDEPDRVEWRHDGFVCLALRSDLGAWCGYVGVPPGHPWYGREWDEIDAYAHGGLNYAAECMDHDGDVRAVICHVPRPGEPEAVYWVGFDCGHADDQTPGMDARLRRLGGPEIMSFGFYRTIGYVKAEVEDLVRQAIEAQSSM